MATRSGARQGVREEPTPAASAPRRSVAPRLPKIVSGGQTGADRAALDWAIDRGVSHGGWCPRGRRAEDGSIPPRYQLRETPSDRYAQRTRWNARDSDGTVIVTVSAAALTGGSLTTARAARALGRPLLRVSQEADGDAAAARLRRFVADHGIRVLNVAGPRASGAPRVGDFVRAVLDGLLGTRGASRSSRRAPRPRS